MEIPSRQDRYHAHHSLHKEINARSHTRFNYRIVNRQDSIVKQSLIFASTSKIERYTIDFGKWK